MIERIYIILFFDKNVSFVKNLGREYLNILDLIFIIFLLLLFYYCLFVI